MSTDSHVQIARWLTVKTAVSQCDFLGVASVAALLLPLGNGALQRQRSATQSKYLYTTADELCIHAAQPQDNAARVPSSLKFAVSHSRGLAAEPRSREFSHNAQERQSSTLARSKEVT